ncbi:MAG: hypothetical protein J3R72DRAFT_425785 [Linnemannia gamsii]|nr:MAG: hypothetical protein J3R72DRAFT_425785 [Linnemannia gamsii]
MTKSEKPMVLIVGGGLGGLMLGALLEKSNVPYTIFERATTVKALGSAMSIGPALFPAFQQLGIYEEFLGISKFLSQAGAYKESMEPYNANDYRPLEEFGGYGMRIVTRPQLYDLMLKQVPALKIHFGKRVLNITEKDDKATVHTSDNNTYEGDIIVGADGAYSAVRQRLYEKLKAKGTLPLSDYEELPFSCTCLIGQTKVLDPEKFPIVNEPNCQFRAVWGENKPYTWIIFSTAEKTLCWMIMHHLSKEAGLESKEQRFRSCDNSEWGSCPAQAMCDETRTFPIPLEKGEKHTLGDLYDLTPKELITKVMFEEKVFSTWYSGRTVLLGDACHKLNPSAGAGAVTAMHDAIALANLFYAMPARTSQEVTTVFDEYKQERYPAALEAFKNSEMAGRVAEKGLEGFILKFIITHMPFWLWKIWLIKLVRYRPQIGFIKAVEVKGVVVPEVSPSEQKARAAFEKQ